MKNTLRLIALVGAIALSWIATERPVYAIQDCLTKEGAACPNWGANGSCYTYEEELQCTWIYPCWCDQGHWRCGQSPYAGSCCGGTEGC
jgi:hypothetical protein